MQTNSSPVSMSEQNKGLEGISAGFSASQYVLHALADVKTTSFFYNIFTVMNVCVLLGLYDFLFGNNFYWN